MKSSKPKGSALLLIIIIVAVLLIGGILFFVLNRKKTATAPSGTNPTQSTGTSTTANSTGSTVTTNQVDIKDMAFTPDSITVKAGSTVTWTNNDGAAHNVTADNNSFSSGTLTAGKTFSQTFNTAGTFKYKCTIHPNMTGVVIVTP